MSESTSIERRFEADEGDSSEEFEDCTTGDEKMEEFVNLDCLDFNGGLPPMENMAASMTPVDPEGKVKKEIITEGTTQVRPGAFVFFHYNSYVEFKEIPFDSTYLREYPESTTLGTGSLLPGIEQALLSMKSGEKSKFLIHYSLAYGKIGFPPRVPPESTILIIIDLLSCFNFGDLDVEDEKDKMYLRASTYCDIAKESFRMKMISAAINHYKQALSTLVDMNNKERTKDLYFKASLNLMVCLNKRRKKSPKAVKDIAQVLIKMVPSLCEGNAKFFYNLGKAHMDDVMHDKALMSFMKAQTLDPSSKLVSKEIVELQKLVKRAQKNEKDFSARALGLRNDKPYNELNETQKMLRDQIEKFAASDNVSIKLPMGLTDSEISFIKRLSSDFKMNFSQQRETYFLTKTQD